MVKCEKLNEKVCAFKENAVIVDGNSSQEYIRYVGNICNNKGNCSFYDKCKIGDFIPINKK